MKEILGIILMYAFLAAGLGIAGWLLYYGFSSGKGGKKGRDIDQTTISDKNLRKV
jgi:hypothetical protein